jgi:hypothetical protein
MDMGVNYFYLYVCFYPAEEIINYMLLYFVLADQICRGHPSGVGISMNTAN